MPIIKEDPHRYAQREADFKQLKGELADAMKYDWKRDVVDDAKKRAITTSANYDEFKGRVDTCTLKPIHRSEFNAVPKFNYNRSAGNAVKSLPGDGLFLADKPRKTAVQLSAGISAGMPKSGREFERQFRRCSSVEDRVALAALLDGEACGRLFGRELDAELLRQLLLALDEASARDESQQRIARQFLSHLTLNCPVSTSSAASFLTSADKDDIVSRLLSGPGGDTEGDDVRICAVLGVRNFKVLSPSQMLLLPGASPDAPLTGQHREVGTTASTSVNEPSMSSSLGSSSGDGDCGQDDACEMSAMD